LRLLFEIKDEKAAIAVDYKGVVPDSFKPGREVVIEGTYAGDGRFKAITIMPKCASKYA
jgi:cytochrome c-type biogenesis protein CcmE